MESIGNASVGKWILDLTNTALFTLLANWGTEHDEITAACDPSKPLQHNQEMFTTMIGRKDGVFSDAFGENHPITFNLSGPIQFADPKKTHGIQIADAVAAAAVYVFSGANDEQAKPWREIIARVGHYGSIVPDLDELKLSDIRAQRNAVLLLALHSRAKAEKSLTDGMPEYVKLIFPAPYFASDAGLTDRSKRTASPPLNFVY